MRCCSPISNSALIHISTSGVPCYIPTETLLHRAPELPHLWPGSGPQCHHSIPCCLPAEHVDARRRAWTVPVKLRIADANNWDDGRRPGTLDRWRGDVQHHTERLLRLALEVAKVHVADTQVSVLPSPAAHRFIICDGLGWWLAF